MTLWYRLVGLMSYCIMVNTSGIKWYVGDGLHLGSSQGSWTGEMGENGQSFAGIAKSLQDQTVGSTVGNNSWIAIDWVTCRSANNISRLNVQSGHCNPLQPFWRRAVL